MLKIFSENTKNNFQDGDKLSIAANILSLCFIQPDEKIITKFNQFTDLLLNSSCRTDSEFNEILRVLNIIYNNEKKIIASPLWQFLAAIAIWRLHKRSITDKSWSIDDYRVEQCVNKAEEVLNFTTINHPLIVTNKYAVCDWLANLYLRNGISEAKRKRIKPDANNPLIKKSLLYYKKMLDMLDGDKNANHIGISSTLLKLAAVQENFLPDNATLEDKHTKDLMLTLERSLNFHLMAPQIDVGKDNQRKSAIIMATLGKLYSKTPKKMGRQPDYDKAVVWLDKTNKSNDNYAHGMIAEINKTPEIEKVRKDNLVKLEKTIERTHKKLVAITNTYLKKSYFDLEKRKILSDLNMTLLDPNVDSKYQAIVNFREKLNNANKQMLFAHRTDAWKRYLYNVFSVIAVIPAITRACNSHTKYGTFCFWKTESQKVIESAEENLSALNFEK